MSIPGSASPLFIGAAAAEAAAYQIDRSLRFNDDDSAYLSRTPSSAGNRKTWTWSAWVKRSNLSTVNVYQRLFEARVDDSNFTTITFTDADQLEIMSRTSGTNNIYVRADAKLRDPSAWYHFIVAVDTTATANTDKCKLYVNGILQDATYYSTTPDNHETHINRNIAHRIGSKDGSSVFFDGYLADCYLIDGSQLDPTSFGAYDDNGVWQPKQYSGTYGTNGFHLDFSDNSSDSALGTDGSGNSNTWTVNNISAAAGIDYLGTGTYTASEWDSTNTIDRIFDGNDGTLAYRPNSAGAGTSTFTFGTTVTVTSSLQIRAWKGDSNERVFANGVDISSHFNTQSGGGLSTQNVTSTVGSTPFTLTSVGSENQNNRAGAIAKIIVDGVTLINGSAGDMDSLIDTPTNYTADSGNNGGNYCTWNPLFSTGTSLGFSEGNLKIATSSSTLSTIGTTIAIPTSGKWYVEVTQDSGTYMMIGVIAASASLGTSTYLYQYSESYVMYNQSGALLGDNSGSKTGSGATFGNGDVIGIALDLDNQQLRFWKNGTELGGFNSVTNTEQLMIAMSDHDGSSSTTATLNTGQRPFKYTNAGTDRPAATYLSLCTQNFPDPTIADGSTAFEAFLYTGDGTSSRNLTLPLAADLVWMKKRSATQSHQLADTVRGDNAVLLTNSTGGDLNPQTQFAYGGISSISNTTVTLSAGTSNNNNLNANSATFVGWLWDAGTSTVTNTDGSITSSVRANPSAGFSIVGYTGNGSTSPYPTVGHGLNAAPKLIITKSRDSSANWTIYTTVIDGTLDFLSLNTTDAASNSALPTSPDSSIFQVGGATNNANGDECIAYCFAPVEGYSKFGSYIGKGSGSNRPLVLTGFRPRWVLFKNTSGSFAWHLYDTARDTFNLCDARLRPDNAAAEDADNEIDILSNGFMPRTNGNGSNQSGSTFIYAAFAEHPFKTARAR